MIQENSSKSYPKLYTSQNRECPSFQVLLFGQQRILTSEDLFELREIVNLNNTPQFKCQGFHSIVFSEQNLAIFHIFLYYCIKTHKGIQAEGLDKLFLSKLSSLYVSKKFKVDIGKFALMCSKCVNIKLRKCIHMIYYLIYGRLATNSYVNSIIAQLNSIPSKKQDKLKTLMSTKFISKRGHSSRSQKNMQQDQCSLTACQKLAQDIKQILYKGQKGDQNENNGCKNYKNQESSSDESDMADNNKDKNNNLQTIRSEKKYYMSFFPNRVFNEERSAIFQNILPSHKLSYRLMRKKKFNDSRIQKMLYLTFNCETQNQFTAQEKDEQQTLVRKERSKIFTQNVIKTNEKFKNSSIELDKIRSVISHKLKKKPQNSSNAQKKHSVIGKNQNQYIQFMKNKKQGHSSRSKVQAQQMVKLDYENQNKFSNLLRKQQKNTNKFKKDSQYCNKNKNQELKILNNLNNQNNCNANKLIFHSQCQNRVFQYKNQYRRFMKIHLFKDNDQQMGKIL